MESPDVARIPCLSLSLTPTAPVAQVIVWRWVSARAPVERKRTTAVYLTSLRLRWYSSPALMAPLWINRYVVWLFFHLHYYGGNKFFIFLTRGTQESSFTYKTFGSDCSSRPVWANTSHMPCTGMWSDGICSHGLYSSLSWWKGDKFWKNASVQWKTF